MLLLLTLAWFSPVLHVQSMDPGPDGHWIQLDQDGKSWDCRSRPDGKDWDPVCVKVDYRGSWKSGDAPAK